MAKIIPSLDHIKNMIKPPPQDGEMALINELLSLSDEYTIYFQPFLNGKHPDVIVVKENCGIIVIEVKDYDLNKYKHIARGRRHGDFYVYNKEKEKDIKIKNPLEQVSEYKDILFDETLPLLGIEKTIDSKNYGVIKSCVFFYNANENQILDKINTSEYDRNKILASKYVYLFGRDTKIGENIEKLLYFKNLNQEISDYIAFQLQPSKERIEQDTIPILNKRQEELSQSREGAQKIKGVAGSGKSLVLAKRALNAIEAEKKVLILSFNITLINYLGDNINRFRSYNKKDVVINNVHGFFSKMYKELKSINDDYSPSINWIEYIVNNIDKLGDDYKFDTILIDEVQDFEYSWLTLIQKLLNKNGEYVLFGDEKQNIYSRALDERKIKTNVLGRWTELKTSYRIPEKMLNLSLEFQKQFMREDYDIDEDIELPEQMALSAENIKYIQLGEYNTNLMYNKIIEIQKELNVSPNDIGILHEKVDVLRELESIFNNNAINCTTTFETKEEYESLKSRYKIDKELTDFDGFEYYHNEESSDNEQLFERDVEYIRKLRKRAFYMNRGTIKLSTIYSFKGWEIDTLFLIINYTESEMSENKLAINELIYTAMTRCKRNLIIIDFNNSVYSKFFLDNIN